MDTLTTEQRSALMRKVKNRDTDIELILRKKLFKRGYRFRLKSSVFGKPDIVFRNKKVAVFCDGDFWHGKNFKKEVLGYKPFWITKITTNIRRDKLVNKTLKKEGWTVLRFWKTDIIKNTDKCIKDIEKYLI